MSLTRYGLPYGCGVPRSAETPDGPAAVPFASFISSRSTWTRRSTFEQRMHLARFDLNLNRRGE